MSRYWVKYATCCKTFRAPRSENGANHPIGFPIAYSKTPQPSQYVYLTPENTHDMNLVVPGVIPAFFLFLDQVDFGREASKHRLSIQIRREELLGHYPHGQTLSGKFKGLK